MADRNLTAGDSLSFCGATLPNTTELKYREKEIIFSQGDAANDLFSIRSGAVKLMVTSEDRKKAVLRIIGAREVFGEECLINKRIRKATAVALEPSIVAKVPRGGVIRAMAQDPAFASKFVAYLLVRLEQVEEELTDQILNLSEKRLAKTLLKIAGVGHRPVRAVDQKTLAEMVGTTRSRVSYFMNRFRRLGMIDYNGSLQVHPALAAFLNRK